MRASAEGLKANEQGRALPANLSASVTVGPSEGIIDVQHLSCGHKVASSELLQKKPGSRLQIHTYVHIHISFCVLLCAHTDPTYDKPRLVEQHSEPRALWQLWLSTYIVGVTAHFIEGLYGPCFSVAPFQLCRRRLKMRWA